MTATSTSDAFKQYINVKDPTHLKRSLTEYFARVLESVRKDPAGEEVLVELIGELAILLPLHVFRRNFHEGNHSTLAGLKWVYDLDLPEQIVKAIDRAVVRSQSVKPPILFRLRDPIDVIGFDPRYPTSDKAEEAFRDLVKESGPRRPEVERVEFTENYGSAKAKVFRDLRSHDKQYDLIFADFTWLSELAAQGQLVPFDVIDPRVESTFDEITESEWGKPADGFQWAEAAKYLSQGNDGFFYCFPVVINSHLRISNPDCPELKENRFGIPNDYEAVELKSLGFGSIQTDHRSSLVFELYSHFAYHGAKPIDFHESPEPVLRNVNFEQEDVKSGLADYLVRLYAYWYWALKKPKVRKEVFQIDHTGERTGLIIPGGPFHWSPCFGSELYNDFAWEGFSQRFSDVRAAYRNTKKKDMDCRLMNFGGYGLAISRRAVNVEVAYQVARSLFAANAGGMVSEAAKKKLVAIEGSTLDFVERHSRPRIPVWSTVENIISLAVEDLFEGLVDHQGKQRISAIPRKTVPEARAYVKEWLGRDDVARRLLSLNDAIELAFSSVGIPTAQRFRSSRVSRIEE